ncbi:TlpA family protein disulfide reductase [Noviherbaspirillum massiliense]|uniref:TlpA family protein disulfide reductase n=1 Tax=Noviherbaspirillum massiliense TaxID=1465823 RepID=UPI0002D6E94C|nr:TlpA disulfide reductase family protein [Noviherbaspirillum massiliense]
MLIAILPKPLRAFRFLIASILLIAGFASPAASAKEFFLRPWPDALPTPSLQLNDLEGRQWDLQDLRGKIVVLNFWATWCEPCVEELPLLNDWASSEAARGRLVILGVNVKESKPTIQRFLNTYRFRYPVLIDRTGEFFKKWTNGVIPTTVLIDRDGRARWRVVGELDPADPGFKQALEKMLEEPR